jgi:hypothetical protein
MSLAMCRVRFEIGNVKSDLNKGADEAGYSGLMEVSASTSDR